MALTKATVTENLNPTQKTAPLTAAVISDGLDAALYEPTLSSPAQDLALVTPDAAVPSQQAAVYVAPHQTESDDGFDSLDEEVNFTSFPMAKITAGQIQLNGVKQADGLVVRCVKVAFQYIVKSGKAQDAKYFFSMDAGKTDTKGNDGEAIKREWVAGGAIPKEFSIKKYAVIHAVDRASKAMIAISVPPSSIGRLAGYKAELAPLGRPPITDVWTHCMLGDVAKATVDGGNVSWTPWNFKYVGPVAEPSGLIA